MGFRRGGGGGFRNRRTLEEESADKPKRINREGWETYKRLLKYVRPYWVKMTIGAVALAFSSLLILALPEVIQRIVDTVLVNGQGDSLNFYVSLMFLVFAVQAVASFVNRITIAQVGANIIRDVRLELFNHLQRLSLTYFANHRTGELVSRMVSDVGVLRIALTENVISLLRQVIQLVGASVLLFLKSWQLTLLILTGMPIISLVIVYLGRQIRTASREVQDKLAGSANVIEETVSGIRIVKSFAREEHEIGRFQSEVDSIYDAVMRRDKIRAILAPIIGFLAFSSITAAMWFGARQVINGNLTSGELVAYLFLTMMVATPISTLANIYSQFLSAIGASERLFEILDTPPDIDDKPDAIELPKIDGRVSFQNVNFDYVSTTPILHDVSFDVEAGKVIALVGPSGAGKSTFVNLIPRFYDVQEGAILIDGYDVRDVQVHSLRDQIGIVPQETTLFSDTVYANILYGRLDATRAELEAAAEAANAHEFIVNDLPNGYETKVGERGVKLSGGQRQRVSIARAILKDPRILILDEATSSLDSESEHLVQEALERLMHGRTSFVIAHRLSTIVDADWILVLDEGRVVEQGTHETLLEVGGLYNRLYEMQFDV